MKNINVKHLIFRIVIYIIALVILALSVQKFSLKINNINDIIIFYLTLVSCIIMGMMIINAGKTYIELSDAILVFLIAYFNKETTVVFCAVYYLINGFMSERIVYHQTDRTKKYLNVAMFVIVTYISGFIYEKFFMSYLTAMDNIFLRYMLTSLIMVGVFLIINITIIKIEYSLSLHQYFKLQRESIWLLSINYVVSSMIAATLLIINYSVSVMGTVLVIGNLIILHYCFYIYRKLQVRNEAIKGLLKITNDIVKYGDFRDKCKHLIISLKDLIPYNICAVYTFDFDNEEVVYPIAYNGPDTIDIGEMAVDMTSEAVTVKTVKEGKIYISKDIRKDKKIKIVGKLAEACDTMILVPIVIEESVMGLIMLGGGQEFINFTNNGINDTLNILSNQMALAIDNDSFYRNIKNMADMDALTRLYNRSVFEREISSLLKDKSQFSLVMYDIDDFKNVNDNYGHLAGDEVLKIISEIIKKSIRKTDVPCRYGGEEFSIIFKDLSKEDALIICERIREKIEATCIHYDSNNIRITVSGGISSYPEDGDTREEIIGIADEALYVGCKQRGKNRVSALRWRVYKETAVDNVY